MVVGLRVPRSKRRQGRNPLRYRNGLVRALAGALLALCVLPVAAQSLPRDTRDVAPPDVGGAPAGGRSEVSTAGVLAAYVARPDDSFQWRVRARYEFQGTDILELDLHSQTWRDILWKHKLFLIKPPTLADPEHGLLVVGGGRWRPRYDDESVPPELPDGATIFATLALELQSVVAVLGQVPFQPLFERNEDQLIAYTFDQYLSSNDQDWPLLLPMVKSAARALDATSQAAQEEWRVAPERFTVLGGSKRGWTTWLLAAIDERVTALAPAVFDALNMESHFAHQTATWGAPSEAIRPYTDLGLDEVLGSDAGAALRAIVDPFEYRAAITQPKLVVLATNDRFFPPDSATLYWKALEGPEYLLYLPNNEHSISDYGRLIPALRALHAATGSGPPLPRLEWEYRWSDDGVTLCVGSDPEPTRIRLWTALAPDRDFRAATWREERNTAGGPYSFNVVRRESNYVAVFAEAVFAAESYAFPLSTNLAIVVPRRVEDTEPRPTGRPGVCAEP
jgi:PhoPQ-activated pathogenicity-related protein